MKISKSLNLICTIEDGDEVTHFHSAPISREVFERYYLVIAKTFSEIFAEEINVVGGPRIAAMMLKDIAQGLGKWEGNNGVGIGLMGEIRRLTSVMVNCGNGWEQLPVNVALDRELLDAELYDEVEGKIVFFILCSAMNTGRQKTAILKAMSALWDVEVSLLTAMEYLNSLPTLTATDNIQTVQS